MNPTPDANWKPDPQLLAAYFDGELESRDDLADLRARLEAYLDAHPELIEELAQHQHLQKLWQHTTPADPSAAAWSKTLDRIEAARHQPAITRSHRRPWIAPAIVAASVAIIVAGVFGILHLVAPKAVEQQPVVIAPKGGPEDFEVLEVARADEVVVRRIEGADTRLMPVGQLPVTGDLELVGRGEVLVRYVRPNPDDQGMPQVIENNGPMIWGKLSSD